MFNTNTYLVFFVADLPFSIHGVAKFAHRTKETAKHVGVIFNKL